MARFTGRTAVITGGATGIGYATAALLAEQGASVVLAGRSEVRGRSAAAAIASKGGRARFVVTDVRDDAQVAALAADAASETGQIELWFGNAGVEGPIGPVTQWTDATVREVLAVNIKGVLSGIRHASAHMRSGGMIVNTASFAGVVVPAPSAVPYAASKAAVVAAGRAAAGALHDTGIAVLTICPGLTDTPMTDRLTGSPGAHAKAKFTARLAPSGHLTAPGEIATVVADMWGGAMVCVTGGAYLIGANSQVCELEVPG